MNKQIIYIFLLNIIFSQTELYDTSHNIDTLSNSQYLQEINHKYKSILGRDKDPKLESDISYIQLQLRKLSWEIATMPGLRFLTKLIYPQSTISHFNVKNAIGFTIDDGFCGKDNESGCMVDEIKQLLKEYNAHATFFVTGSHCQHNSIKQINSLIKDGHEISNHNMMDWSYKNYSKNDFEYDLHITKSILLNYNQSYSQWYRAPFGRLSKTMEKVINEKNLIHVVPDVFANDTYIPDPEWIAEYILKRIKPGSIILIHMPEKEVREWNYIAMELTLKGLKEKKFQILNLSEMNKLHKK